MKKSVARKFDRHTAAFDWDEAMSARTFAEFDDCGDRPSARLREHAGLLRSLQLSDFLNGIERPTLIINALDDPFMTPDVIPTTTALRAA